METSIPHLSKAVKDPVAQDAGKCPGCNSARLFKDTHRGELICRECGIVIECGTFDSSHGTRAYTAEEIKAREHYGSPISPTSDISWSCHVPANNTKTSPPLAHALRWNPRLPWDKRNLLQALTEIKRVCSSLDVPRLVADTAATYYRKVLKLNVLRGRSISGFVGACVYLACRTSRVPRSVEDVYKEMPNTTDRDIRICHRVLISELKIRPPRISAAALLPRYASALDLQQDVTNFSMKLLAEIEAHCNTTGKDPKGLIAAALYIACNHRGRDISQKCVADACCITEVTLRARLKEFAPILSTRPPS
jgi:transcription initiation factor TFIIB